jgi:hypothetical protein
MNCLKFVWSSFFVGSAEPAVSISHWHVFSTTASIFKCCRVCFLTVSCCAVGSIRVICIYHICRSCFLSYYDRHLLQLFSRCSKWVNTLWRTPFLILLVSESIPLILIWHFVSFIVALTKLANLLFIFIARWLFVRIIPFISALNSKKGRSIL